MKEIIEKITSVPGVRGAAVISKDGLLIEKVFYDNESSEIIGAMVAKINKEMETSLGKATDDLPILSNIYAQNGEIIFLAKSEFLVTVLCEKKTNIGVVIIKIREAARELKNHI